MRKFIVLTMLSLDGVMQAPGGPEEDTANGFRFGGWVAPYSDEVGNEAVKKLLEPKVDYLLGRKTFGIWEGYWPQHAEFWPNINEGTKYVLSKTRKQSDWENSAFLETVDDIKKLKHSEGPDIQVWGSSQLVQLLLQHDLVDELFLQLYPVLLGKGKRLFNEDSFPGAFTLTESFPTPSGVIFARYKRAGEVKTGTAGA